MFNNKINNKIKKQIISRLTLDVFNLPELKSVKDIVVSLNQDLSKEDCDTVSFQASARFTKKVNDKDYIEKLITFGGSAQLKDVKVDRLLQIPYKIKF